MLQADDQLGGVTRCWISGITEFPSTVTATQMEEVESLVKVKIYVVVKRSCSRA